MSKLKVDIFVYNIHQEGFEIPEKIDSTIPITNRRQMDSNKDIFEKLISTPFVLVAYNHYDFDYRDANIVRMIREAQLQNADVVGGSYQDLEGRWHLRYNFAGFLGHGIINHGRPTDYLNERDRAPKNRILINVV